MKFRLDASAHMAVLCALALLSGCGGGGGGSSAPPPAPPPPTPPANRAPSLSPLSLVTDEDAPTSAQLSATDPDGNPITFVLATNAQHGIASVTAGGVLTYTPSSNYSGADAVGVTVSDNAGGQATGTINLTVSPVNDAPTAADDSLRVAAANGQPVTLAVLTNDTDIEGDELTPQVVSQPEGGSVVVDATTREMRFEPDNGYVGPIDFTYRVSDGSAQSNVAAINAYIGESESVIFLSDYTTPGTLELHVFDGLEVRRVNDDLPSGGNLSTFGVSSDTRTLAYVVDSADAERVYVKSLDDSAPAVLRFTSTAKTVPSERRVSVSVNADGTFLLIRDGWVGDVKNYYVADVDTGVTHRVAESMPGIVDTRIVLFHAHEPTLLLAQGQTSGTGPSDLANRATSAFVADAADPRTLDQIGRSYAPGQCGSGEGIYAGNDGRYIYHAEFLCALNVINLIAYDRQTDTETYVVRQAALPDHGLNGVAAPNPAISRLCFAFYLPSTTNNLGPTQFYAMDTADPLSATPVTPVHSGTTQCTMASDDRTMIYRLYSAGFVSQEAYAIDSTNPGTPAMLAPANEVSSEQAALQVAVGAMRTAIAYFNNDGVPGFADGQVGRYYAMPSDGSPDHFLFSDTYVPPTVGSVFNGIDGQGDFVLYARPAGGISTLELMSTHVLNLSIPLSRPGEILGVRTMRWLRNGVR